MLREAVESGTADSRWAVRVRQMLRIEWLGQMVASLCWIASVFSYGISSQGDWLQLLAATSWFVANVASIMTAEVD